MAEQTDKQAESKNNIMKYPIFKRGPQLLVYRPYQHFEGPNPNLLKPWRRSCMICSQLSPVVYRLRQSGDSREISIHIAHLKLYHNRKLPPEPDFDKVKRCVFGQVYTFTRPGSPEADSTTCRVIEDWQYSETPTRTRKK